MRIPSSVPQGGMRMSVITTSGCCAAIAASSSLPSEQTLTSSIPGSEASITVRLSRMR